MTKSMSPAELRGFQRVKLKASQGDGNGCRSCGLTMADSDGGYTDLFSSPLVQSYISKAASDRGIDPRAAINVFRIESGLNPFTKAGDMGSSPGVAQLHFAGMAPGVLSSTPDSGTLFPRPA